MIVIILSTIVILYFVNNKIMVKVYNKSTREIKRMVIFGDNSSELSELRGRNYVISMLSSRSIKSLIL
jgi:hypothetical protein